MKQTIIDLISELVVNIKSYFTSKVDLYLLTAVEKIAKLHSSIVSLIIIILISFFCIFFITIAVAIWLGIMINNTALGFLIVGGGYFLIGLLFIVFKKSLIDNRVIKSLIKSLFPDEKNNRII